MFFLYNVWVISSTVPLKNTQDENNNQVSQTEGQENVSNNLPLINFKANITLINILLVPIQHIYSHTCQYEHDKRSSNKYVCKILNGLHREINKIKL